MASSKTWENYRSPNLNKGTDEEVLSMIADLADAIILMDKMYGESARLLTRTMIQDWYSLVLMAQARGLHNYKAPYAKTIDVEAEVVTVS